MLFQVVEPGKARAEGRHPPPQKMDESGFRGLFSSVDLYCLISPLGSKESAVSGKNVARVSTSAPMPAWAWRARGFLMLSSGEGLLFQQPVGPPTSINHTHHWCACTTLQPTPATNQHRWGRRGDVLMVLHVRTRTCEHVPAHRQVETKEKSWGGLICQRRRGGHCKAEDGGKKTRNKRWRPKKTNGEIRYKETGSKKQTYRSNAKWRVWNWEMNNEDRLLQEPTQHRFQQGWPSFHSQLLSFSDIIVFLYINLHVCFFPLFPPFLSSPSLRTSASHRMLLLSLLKAKENQISPLNHSYFNGKQPDIKKKGGLEMERMWE